MARAALAGIPPSDFQSRLDYEEAIWVTLIADERRFVERRENAELLVKAAEYIGAQMRIAVAEMLGGAGKVVDQ